MKKEELENLHQAYEPGFKFHDENLLMLGWCAQRMITTLRGRNVSSLVSLGIGHRVVSRTVMESLGSELASYTIVEGSSEAIRALEAECRLPASVRVVNAFFEEFEPPGPVDAVEMGFVLEHVEDPLLLARRYASFLKPGGILVVAVPNARSLHRLFGHEAGLLRDVYQLSPQDLELGHRRYFDLASIQALLEEAGLRIVAAEGVYLKCLTTAQLRGLELPPEVVTAFLRVAVPHPDISNAIYLEAVR